MMTSLGFSLDHWEIRFTKTETAVLISLHWNHKGDPNYEIELTAPEVMTIQDFFRKSEETS